MDNLERVNRKLKEENAELRLALQIVSEKYMNDTQKRFHGQPKGNYTKEPTCAQVEDFVREAKQAAREALEVPK